MRAADTGIPGGNRAHPFVEQPDLKWSELKHYPVAYNIQQSGNWLKIQCAMDDEHIRLNWFHQIQSILGALMLVRKGDGLAVVLRCAVEALCIPDLVFREVSAPDIYREIGILTRSSSLQTIDVREFIEVIRRQFG
ncbi:LysR substrate-binding domain-containing protein [Marinobacterium aestuariivivens]|uniref:LysR substrate-binding domain-containing protein n=1 Tax=Marinobacterium aestuariivivens TaxID=1698799 RepID=A0ABW1ZZ96_9GAMM